MKKNRLLENLSHEIGSQIPMRRYSLADIISESYKIVYECEEGSNLKRLAESHLKDVKENPRDIERLSRQLSIIKELNKLTESGELKDEDLVDKKEYDTVDPKEERVIQKECNEGLTGAIGAKVGDTIIDTKLNKEGVVQKVGTSGNYSILYVDFGNGVRRINPMDDAQTKGRYSLKKESIKESEDPELTDEELEELAKHLETIRKDKKNAPKTEMKEEASPRRGIKCSMKDSKKNKKPMNEASESYVVQYGIDILSGDNQEDIEYKIEYALTKAGLKVLGVQPTDTSWSVEEYEKLIGMSVDDLLGESKKEKIDDCNESRSYAGLANFKKQSESKAFYKTFKKMHESLKEGRALTRQESIDLYKASNSALTQLSIELEHNPEFLGTFKESVSLLSKDVSSLLESLTRGKAPSKATMKSLAKFSEALLNESATEDYMKDWAEMDYEKGKPIDNYEEWSKLCSSEGIEPSKKLHDLYMSHYKSMDESVNEGEEEKMTDDKGQISEKGDFDDFVGDDEGDMQSKEADAFDQEYAEERVELHKELADKHADDDDPGVQEKLAQDADEVSNLPGVTDEQIAELTGGTPEDSEGDDIEDEPEEEEVDDSDITDDELEELKKHLKEMRVAKKSK